MTESDYTFDQARARLEEIVTQVRKKDVSLEKSLDLLEEGVRLANVCTELSDHTEWRRVADEAESEANESETVPLDSVSDEQVAASESDVESAEDSEEEFVDDARDGEEVSDSDGSADSGSDVADR